jgi:hypothetical protein
VERDNITMKTSGFIQFHPRTFLNDIARPQDMQPLGVLTLQIGDLDLDPKVLITYTDRNSLDTFDI